MTKAEALSELNSSGSIKVQRRSPAWVKAFDLYNASNIPRLNMSCGGCYRKVLAWLQS